MKKKPMILAKSLNLFKIPSKSITFLYFDYKMCLFEALVFIMLTHKEALYPIFILGKA